MHKHLSRFGLVLAFCVAGSAIALAGQNDWTARMNTQNALCDSQRRGEIPRNPDMCLPSLPPEGYREPSMRQ